MSATLYTDIVATRTESGRLWTPELSLDLMGNDWAVMGQCADWGFDEAFLISDGDPSYRTILDVWIGFPDAFTFDNSYDEDLRLRAAIRIEARRDNTGSPVTLKLVLGAVDSSAVGGLSTSYAIAGPFNLDLITPVSGMQLVSIQATMPGPATEQAVVVRRTFGGFEADCYVQPQLV